MRKKSTILNAVILLLLVGMVAWLTTSLAVKPVKQDKVEDFAYTDIHEHQGSLYQSGDRQVILHFWATWCAPCRDELPLLFKKAAQMPGTTFLLISSDQDKQAITDFLKHEKLALTDNMTVIQDKNGLITQGHFKVDGFPETIILKKDKTIAQHIYGEADWRKINE